MLVSVDDARGGGAALTARGRAVIAAYEEQCGAVEAAGLGVGLFGDAVDQRFGQRRHVHQPGPGELKGGAELGHEVAHAGITATDYRDTFALILVRIVKLILDERKFGTGHGQPTKVPLNADR